MMSYEVFKNVLKTRVQNELPTELTDCEVTIYKVNKTNCEKDALILKFPEGSGKSAVTYLDDLYMEFEDTQDLDAMVKKIIAINMAYTKPIEFDLKKSFSPDNIIACVINKEQNAEFLSNTPHYELFGDIIVICRYIVSIDEQGVVSIVVNYDILKEFGITEEKLFYYADKNTFELFPVEVKEFMPGFYIMSNKEAFYGANVLLNNKLLKSFTQEVGGSYYILPSSVHEIIVVPTSMHELKGLQEALFEGNEGFVTPEEFLSNTVYMYDELIDAVVKAGA